MIENTEYFCIWNLNMVLIYIVGIYKTDYSVSIKIIISQVFLQKGILLFIENSDKSVLKDLLQSLYYPWFSRTSFVCFKFKSYFTQGLQKMSNSHIDCKEEKLWIINCYVEGGSISCLPYHSKMTYCLKLFEKYFWQNICTVNLQYKLTIARLFLNFQKLRTTFHSFPKWLCTVDREMVFFFIWLFVNSLCSWYVSLPFPLVVFCY